MQRVAILLLALAGFCSVATSAAGDDPTAVESVLKVGHNGEGHAAAKQAIAELSRADADQLVTILAAMDKANPLAANWLRGAFEAVAARSLDSDAGLPVDDLLGFFRDTSHSPRARRLAYEWALRARPDLEEQIIPESIDDPSPEMRRDAVELYLRQGIDADNTGRKEQAVALYRKALSGAGDEVHVKQLTNALKELGESVDLVDHYGLITEWQVIGPFDNTGGKGFDIAYPPEEGIDLAANYPGKGEDVHWQRLQTDEEDGRFDLAALTEPHKGAVDYVTTEFLSERDQPVEFRLATANAWKLWVNGELLFAREEYHRGMRFDQYRVEGELRKGRNRILLKVCQNEQDQDWAQRWSFQFRVCDPYGRSLHSLQQVAASKTSRD